MLRAPARLTRGVLPAVCFVGLTLTPQAQEQPSPAPAAEPKFEVTSVKKSGPPGQGPFRFGMQPGGRFSVTQMPVVSLITMAYGIQRFQLVGAPAWVTSDRFDINAVAEDVPSQPTLPGTPNRMQLLLRSLLKDRFKLAMHNETREMPLSYLVVAREDRKLGERLRRSAIDCAALFAARAKEAKEGGPPRPLEPPKPGEIPQSPIDSS